MQQNLANSRFGKFFAIFELECTATCAGGKHHAVHIGVIFWFKHTIDTDVIFCGGKVDEATLARCGAIGRHAVANVFNCFWKSGLNGRPHPTKSLLDFCREVCDVLVDKRTLLVAHGFIILFFCSCPVGWDVWGAVGSSS